MFTALYLGELSLFWAAEHLACHANLCTGPFREVFTDHNADSATTPTTALSFAFLWPKLYTKFKREIDQAFGEANKQFEFHYSKIKEHVLGKVANEKDLVRSRIRWRVLGELLATCFF